MHGSDFGMETSVPHKKRCRASKKKRLRLKKRESLEPAVGAKSDNQDEGRELSTNRDKVQNCNDFQDIESKEAQQQQRIYDLTQFDQQQQKTRQIQDLTLNQDQIEKQDGNMDGDASEEKQAQDEMTEYERKRRDNILRNQVFMQQVGVSTAKLAARTAVGNEAENEEKRKEMVARRALAATRKAELLCQPVRKSKRLQREKVVTKARDRLLKLMTKSVGKLSGVRAVKTMDPVLFSHGDVPEMKPHSLREVAENGNDQTNSNEDQDHDQHSAPASRTEAENEAQQKEMTTRRSLVTVQKACLLSRPVGKPSKLRSEKIVMKLKTGADPGQIRPHSNLEKNDANRNISKQELDQDEQEVVTGYERKRLENILRNEAFLKQVGVSTVKVAACAALQNEAAQEAKRQELASKRALKASRRTELLKQPVRKSRRLSGEKAVVRESNGLDYSMDLLSMKTIRLNCTGKVHVMDVIDDEGKAFCQEIIGSFHERSNIEQALVPGDAEDDVEYTLETNDIVKAVPYRITTLAFLPRADRVGVACGDKEGLVSLWSPSSSNNSTTSSAAMYRPHGYPVTQLIFPTSSTLISSSMDGTVCEFDLWSSKTSLVCDISYETGITSLAESGNPQFYYASCEDGTVRLIDRRARNLYSGGFRLHKGKINTVDQHPTLDYCIATAGQDLNVCFWDKRKIASEGNVPISKLRHRSERHCAQFSKHDGAWLVTLSCESYMDMYDTSRLVKCGTSDTPLEPSRVHVPHNNNTGTSTKFRPAWDPKRPNRFAIGCWGHPSRLQIFRAGYDQPIRELVRKEVTNNSFDVVTQYHPYLDLIASGNSTGRLSLWRAKNR